MDNYTITNFGVKILKMRLQSIIVKENVHNMAHYHVRSVDHD